MSGAASEGVEGAPSVRERIVQATLQALRELDDERLLSSIGVRALAARAGVGTSSVYHHVGSLGGLADALEQHVYTVGATPTTVTAPAIQQLTSTEFPLRVALGMHTADLARLAGDPGLRARMWLWTLGGERARARYADYLRTIDHRLAVLAETMYSAWDREPRPPFDYLTLIAVVVANTQGAAFRQLSAPDPTLVEPHTRTQVAISTAVLRRTGDHRDLDAHLVELTYLPSGPDQPAAGPRSTAASRILFSAGELFRVQGFADTTLAQVARRADVSPSTLHRWYDGKDAIALALLRSEARDLLPGTDPEATLQRHLEQVVDFARPRLRYLTPYVSALLTGALPDDDPLLAPTTALLPGSGTSGTGRRLLLVLLQRLHHAPNAPASELAGGAVGLLGLHEVEEAHSATTW